MKQFYLAFFMVIKQGLGQDVVFEPENEKFNQSLNDSVEFIASYKDQPYLKYVEENDKDYLDLYNFQESMFSSDFSSDPKITQYCAKDFYAAFGITSYFMPVQKPSTINECPQMKETCCYESSLQQLNELWENKYKVYLDYNYEYFRYYLVQIMSKHQKIVSAAKQVFHMDRNHMCKSAAEKIFSIDFTGEDLKKLKKNINKLKLFDMNLKQNFMCFLCDYESQKNFHLKDKIVTMKYGVCENLVKETFDPYYYLNEFIYKYLNTANFLTYCINNEDTQNYGIINADKGNKIEYIEIDNTISHQQCKYAVDNNLNLMTNCFHYCSNYNFWYMGEPIFRDITKLGKIFNNLNNKIFQNKIGFKIKTPAPMNQLMPIFEVKLNSYNVFDYFQYVFKEKEGIETASLFTKAESN